jgi:DNA-binding transcriptional MerR regulator
MPFAPGLAYCAAVSTPVSGTLRIGEFSRRVGVSATVLRAWERRYGLFEPDRTTTGYRLYGPRDEHRARRMLTYLRRGLAPAESARIVLDEGASSGDALARLSEAWERLDIAVATRALDEVLDVPAPEVAMCRSVLPVLDRLASDPALHGHAHVAHRMAEARLLALATRWHEGSGPLALVACGAATPDAVQPIACGLALHRRGLRIAYLGPGASPGTIAAVAGALTPDRVVLAAIGADATGLGDLRGVVAGLRSYAAEGPVAAALGATPLTGDPLDWALAIAY